MFTKSKVIRFRFDHLARQIARLKPDIVHSHFGNIGAADVKRIRGTGVKHVVTFYGYDVSMLPKTRPSILPKYKLLFAQVDRVLCEGPFMAERVAELGCPRDKIRVHPIGVDLEKLEFRPRSWNGKEPLKILIAASFKEKKGIPYAIEAIAKVAKTTDVELTIIGDANKTPGSQSEKNKIQERLKQSTLAGKARLMGYQPHQVMIEMARQNHLFVSTSVTAADGDSEGGAPVSLIEMAATGIPIVSSFHCDIPGVILDGETGWLAKERDVDAIHSCLLNAINLREEWVHFLKAGRAHVEKNFSAPIQGQRLATLYKEVLQ